MNNPQQEMDYLCSQLDEFYAYWYPGKNRDNDQAKAVLTKVSKEIKSFPVEAKKQECFPVEFLDILTHIYFSLSTSNSIVEQRANIFAGELLMPSAQLEAVSKKLILPTIKNLAKVFEVSEAVMSARLKHLDREDLYI